MKEDRGIYDKFRVERTDGRSARGEKHDRCTYFVLDVTHDPHAFEALHAYAKSCERELPRLAADLRSLARYGEALQSGLSDHEARAEGWPDQ